MKPMLQVKTRINDEWVQFLCDPDETVLSVLRNRLGLIGTKEGCATGDCGACSIMLNGRLVCACLVLAAELEEQSVETVEGISKGSELHPIQQKLLDNAALQCGICTPGIVVAAKALLDRNPAPDERQIRFALAGNLCRCTGYDKIIRSVMSAAKELTGENDCDKN